MLFIKPRNTLSRDGRPVEIPRDPGQVEISAQLGIVIAAPCMRVSPIEALDRVAGYAIVNDISLPHRSFYRPSIRLQARVGLCPVSHNVVPRHLVVDPDALTVRVLLDGQMAHLTSTADRVRPVGRLLADISAFMTLMPGDILTLGYAKATKQIQAAKNG